MLDTQLHRARVMSSIAATVISLACGTNYVYSAWAPQFADKLFLSATESNLIGLAGNLGMYSMGVPIGLFVDHRGPRPAVLIGAVLLGIGYLYLHTAFQSGSGSFFLMLLFSYLTGFGGCMAFAAAIKISAINWPHHRGTATAFPLAAFGLSAFFFSVFGSLFFPGDTGAFLSALAVGTFGLPFVGFFFLRILPHSSPYSAIPTNEAARAMTDATELRRPSEETKVRHSRSASTAEPGTSSPRTNTTTTTTTTSDNNTIEAPHQEHSAVTGSNGGSDAASASSATPAQLEGMDPNETSSLMSDSSCDDDLLVETSIDKERSHRIDIRGWQLMRNVEFWQLFTIMGILSGIGLMTINNIGNDAIALWLHYDENVDESFLIARQQMHVSILSVCSFSGRLLSGVGSDFLVKALKASRVWCLVFASLVFSLGQLCALNIRNPNLLGFVSGLNGLGYGFLFGVFPSIVAETFGIHGLSQNWGFMTLSPVLSGNVFNLFYGAVFDAHSLVGPGGDRTCHDGLACYWSAYLVTLAACAFGLVVTLATIRHQHASKGGETKGAAED